MGQLLDELLEEVKESESDEQIRIICDIIYKEELSTADDIEKYEKAPKGANIFLSLPVGDNSYICLQREAAGSYAVSMWTLNFDRLLIRNTWNIKEIQPQKIMKAFAERLKWAKGE